MGKYRVLGSLLDRVFRNNLNANFNDVDSDIQAQKKRVDDLIKGTPQPSEIVDARGGFSVLRDRLDDFFAKLLQLFSRNVYVTDYGAKGDGTTDDTKAFNDAINALTSGGKIFVPPGTYMIEGWATGSVSDYPLGGIKVKSNITIEFLPGAKLKAKSTTKDNYAILNITAASNVRIIGGELIGERGTHIDDPNGQWGYGVAVVGSDNVSIEGTIARDCFGDGFYVGHNQAAGTESKRIRLLHCHADNNRRQGLSICGAIDVLVLGGSYRNTIGHFPESGIDLEPNPGRIVKNVKIINATLEGNRGHGLQLGMACEAAIIVGNTANSNGLNGIYGGQCNHHIIENNECYDNGESGLFLVDCHSNILNGNKFYHNQYHGAMIGNGTNNIITNNHFYENSQKTDSTYNGLELFGSSRNSIQSNVCRIGTATKKQKYGINISDAQCSKNLVIMNDLMDGGALLGLHDLGDFTETTAGNRWKDGTWAQYAG